MAKIAYPQDENGLTFDSPRDVQKWMNAMRTIYTQANVFGWNNAFEKITSGWDLMEKQEFKNWMSFYQTDTHKKYKTAQFAPRYIENGVGSFIPTDSLKASLPVRQPDMGEFSPQQQQAAAEEENRKKEDVRRLIQSLIGRLNSAERLATRPDVQIALKKSIQMSYEEWVALLQKLKREIQLAPMRNAASPILNDILIKNANQLKAKGQPGAAAILIKISQMAQAPGPSNTMGAPTMNPIDAPMGNQPVGMDPPSTGPAAGKPQENSEAPTQGKDEGKDNEAMIEFIKGLGGSTDENQAEDEESDPLAEITVTAQATPPPPALSDKPIEVSEDDLAPAAKPLAPVRPTAIPISPHDPFESALSNVKISDIAARLEAIASMFKNREIARQLSIIDLMMDRKGIATFFPTLAEAMRSALESNQYCQSRIEDILAKLRGTIDTPLSLKMQNDIGSDEAIKQNLAKEEIAEKARKEQRKQIQQQEQAAEATAASLAPQELAAPVQVQPGPATPVRPVG